MALSKSALKAKFVTDAIPTQTDFANLIDGMLSMPLGGGTGDTTINFGKGDSSDRIVVQNLRYIFSNGVSYFLIGSHDYDTNENFICVIIKFQDSPSLSSWAITYHILDDVDRQYLYDKVGDINEADEQSILKWLDSARLPYYNIENRTNNNPNPRIINSGVITYTVYPALQNSEWYVGYAFAMDVDMGGSNDLYVYRCTGNSQTKWTAIDKVIANDLENAGKFSKKLLY